MSKIDAGQRELSMALTQLKASFNQESFDQLKQALNLTGKILKPTALGLWGLSLIAYGRAELILSEFFAGYSAKNLKELAEAKDQERDAILSSALVEAYAQLPTDLVIDAGIDALADKYWKPELSIEERRKIAEQESASNPVQIEWHDQALQDAGYTPDTPVEVLNEELPLSKTERYDAALAMDEVDWSKAQPTDYVVPGDKSSVGFAKPSKKAK